MRHPSKNAWSLRAICRALFRFKWRAIGFFGTTVVLAIVGLVLCPRAYWSEAKLLIRIGRESVSLDPTATTTGQVVGFNNSRANEINSIIEVITSRPILEKVIDRRRAGKPFSTPLERERAVRELMKSVQAWSPKQTNVVMVAAEDRSPEAAQATVQAIVDAYREEHIRIHRTSGSYEFFEEQSGALREQLEEATQGLSAAKNEYGFVALDGRRESLQKQIGDLETTVRNIDSDVIASNAKAVALRSSLDGLPAAVVATLAGADTSTVNLRQQLFQLQTREQELLSQRTEHHPTVIAIRRQVHDLEQILNSEKVDHGSAMSMVLLEEDSKLKSLTARKEKLAEQQQALTSALHTLNEQESHIARLKREVELLGANYKTYSESFEQSRIDQALNTEGITNVSEVQPASFEPKPASPKKGYTLAIAWLIGLCGAVGTALLSEQLDQSLHSADDVEEHLRLPLFTSIPEMKAIPGSLV
jgi:uncharacterized protein involved in exopolysaccharide biosynthesis